MANASQTAVTIAAGTLLYARMMDLPIGRLHDGYDEKDPAAREIIDAWRDWQNRYPELEMAAIHAHNRNFDEALGIFY